MLVTFLFKPKSHLCTKYRHSVEMRLICTVLPCIESLQFTGLDVKGSRIMPLQLLEASDPQFHVRATISKKQIDQSATHWIGIGFSGYDPIFFRAFGLLASSHSAVRAILVAPSFPKRSDNCPFLVSTGKQDGRTRVLV